MSRKRICQIVLYSLAVFFAGVIIGTFVVGKYAVYDAAFEQGIQDGYRDGYAEVLPGEDSSGQH